MKKPGHLFKVILPAVICLAFYSCNIRKITPQTIQSKDVERIIKTLASDEMQGREVFSPGIERAARFIETEFSAIGLQPLKGQSSFRQDFTMLSIKPAAFRASVNGKAIDDKKLIFISEKQEFNWTNASGVELQYIKDGESFMSRYRSIMSTGKPTVVFVDEQFFDAFGKVRSFFMNERVVNTLDDNKAVVFVMTNESPATYELSFKNNVIKSPLFNIAGIIPGQSKPDEYVIFSGHYDHLGIIEAANGDSIANGADDDASGVTAVISLARYYKRLNNNPRTLIFVAFTGEESGMLGSKHFSEKMNPEQVTAMFNIEMIGKESKFGKNAAFITGYDRSDFGSILQKNLSGTGFTFHPDPYTEQQLFYRSDNATLAAQGVPAHTISTDKIDIDKFYHTVDDEVETLDIDNILATIRAIALSSRTIVDGTDTPKRIPPLENRKP